MKHIKLVVLSLGALVFGRPAGFCTANTLTDDVAAVNERLAKLEAENAKLREQLATPPPAAPAEDTGMLAALCRGAGVDIADVRWRINAAGGGLSPEQAVEAAIAQKQHDEASKAKK